MFISIILLVSAIPLLVLLNIQQPTNNTIENVTLTTNTVPTISITTTVPTTSSTTGFPTNLPVRNGVIGEMFDIYGDFSSGVEGNIGGTPFYVVSSNATSAKIIVSPNTNSGPLIANNNFLFNFNVTDCAFVPNFNNISSILIPTGLNVSVRNGPQDSLLSQDGKTAILSYYEISSPKSYVFVWNFINNNWTQTHTFISPSTSAQFGITKAISADGKTFVSVALTFISNIYNYYLIVYEKVNDLWDNGYILNLTRTSTSLIPNLLYQIQISGNGKQILFGSSNDFNGTTGAIYFWTRNSYQNWTVQKILNPPNCGQFGYAVGMSLFGNRIAVYANLNPTIFTYDVINSTLVYNNDFRPNVVLIRQIILSGDGSSMMFLKLESFIYSINRYQFINNNKWNLTSQIYPSNFSSSSSQGVWESLSASTSLCTFVVANELDALPGTGTLPRGAIFHYKYDNLIYKYSNTNLSLQRFGRYVAISGDGSTILSTTANFTVTIDNGYIFTG